MKKFILSTLLATFVVAVIVAACLANYFCSSLSLNSSLSGSGVYAVAEECYLVCVSKSQNKLEAETLAGDCINEGSAGYIFKYGDYFYVVHSAYEKQNDSTLMVEHLKKQGIASEILNLSFPKIFVEEELSQEKRNLLQEVLNGFFSSFRSLCDLAVGSSTKVYSIGEITDKLQKLAAKVETLQKRFAEKFDVGSAKLLSIGEYLSDEVECIMLAQPTEKDLNYRAIELVDIYRNMCEELG